MWKGGGRKGERQEERKQGDQDVHAFLYLAGFSLSRVRFDRQTLSSQIWADPAAAKGDSTANAAAVSL